MNSKKEVKFLKFLGGLLILGSLIVAVFPYIHSMYNQWAYPIPDIQSEEPIEEPTPVVATEDTPDSSVPDESSAPEEEVKEFLPISGRLVISCLELDLEVGYGVEKEDLLKGPGFYPQSDYPDSGNVSIAGHRNGPFLNLDKLKPDDKIELYYDDVHYVYSVESVYITHNRDWSVVESTDKPAVTLTTCHPIRSVDGHYDRLIVRAYLQYIDYQDNLD